MNYNNFPFFAVTVYSYSSNTYNRIQGFFWLVHILLLFTTVHHRASMLNRLSQRCTFSQRCTLNPRWLIKSYVLFFFFLFEILWSSLSTFFLLTYMKKKGRFWEQLKKSLVASVFLYFYFLCFVCYSWPWRTSKSWQLCSIFSHQNKK